MHEFEKQKEDILPFEKARMPEFLRAKNFYEHAHPIPHKRAKSGNKRSM
jgi:hypothetical protein